MVTSKPMWEYSGINELREFKALMQIMVMTKARWNGALRPRKIQNPRPGEEIFQLVIFHLSKYIFSNHKMAREVTRLFPNKWLILCQKRSTYTIIFCENGVDFDKCVLVEMSKRGIYP